MELISVNNTKLAIYLKKSPFEETSPFVLIHGFTGTALLHYNYEIQNYSKTFKTSTLGYDLRGHGFSLISDKEEKDFNIDDLFNDLISLIDFVNWDKINLIGSSFGGLLASNYVLKFPKRVNHLVLISSSVSSGPSLIRALEKLDTNYQRLIANYDNLSKLPLKDHLRYKYLLKIHNNSIEAIKFQKKINKRFLKDTKKEFSIIEDLKTINTPTLVIHGDKDYIDVEKSVEIYRALINCRLLVIPNAGHLPQINDPKMIENNVKKLIM
ncbi:MAG: alpha/beta fold hydrolase [Candidatus Hodarchaeales archaeon]